MDYINQMPSKILIRIFSYFMPDELSTRIIPVCHNWRNIASEKILWRHLDIFNDSMVSVTHVLKIASQLTSLYIPESENIDEVLHLVALNCPKLSSLEIDGSGEIIDDDIMKKLAKDCPLLESLSLKQTRAFDSDAFFGVFDMRNLKSLNIQWCFWMDNEFIKKLSRSCLKLRELKISPSKKSDNVFSTFLNWKGFHLESLIVDQLPRLSLSRIERCRNLRTLKISCGFSLNNTCFTKLSTLSNLECLEIEGGSHLTSEAFEYIFKHGNFHHLRTLRLRQCSGMKRNVIEQLARTCTSLTDLSLEFCLDVYTNDIIPLVQYVQPNMQHLCLMGLELTKFPSLRLKLAFPNLKSLDVACCFQLHWPSLKVVREIMPDLSIITF